MPSARNRGIRIHYEVEGEGPPLVLHHGFASSLEMFRRLDYTEALNRDFRLILIDARGHGKSDKPHAPDAYGPEIFAEDVLSVLDDLAIRESHYFGYSLGGRIGFALAKAAPQRLISMIIGCSHPFAENFAPLQGINPGDRAAFPEALERLIGETMTEEMKALALFNDLEALVAAARPWPGVEDVLPDLSMPCLVFAGTAEVRYPEIRRAALLMPDADFFSLEGLNHVQAFLRSDLVIPRIRSFLKKTGIES